MTRYDQMKKLDVSTDICDGTEPTLALVHQEKQLQVFTNTSNVGKGRKQDDTEFLPQWHFWNAQKLLSR